MRVQIDPPTNILTGKVSVTTAGTRVILGKGECVSITITAPLANTNVIYVGNSTVDRNTGYQLSPGSSISFDISNLGTVWLDCEVSGESVTYLANQ